MCNQWCLGFSTRALAYLGSATRMLEVGSLNVNGSVRSVLGQAVSAYHGVDIRPGPGVDEVLDVARLVERFGVQAFDVVTSTEMLEHCYDWQGALFQMLSVLRPGGLFLLTTRSPGFPLHDHPADYWRFEKEELARLLEPVGVFLELEDDFSLGWPCGVGMILRRHPDGPDLGEWLVAVRRHRTMPVDPVGDAFNSTNSQFMPFHEYSASRACAEVIGMMAPTPRVLDLSEGTGSRLKLCAPRLQVRHRPVGDGARPEAVAREAGYDCAVAVNTLARLTAERRDAWLEALAAVAKTAVIVVDAFPSVEETAVRLDQLGFHVAVFANGYTPWFVPLTELWRHSQERPGVPKEEVAPLLAQANMRFAPLDYLEPAHRRVLVGVRGAAVPALPTPSVEAYREAGRRMGEWWSRAAPFFERVFPAGRAQV